MVVVMMPIVPVMVMMMVVAEIHAGGGSAGVRQTANAENGGQ
jgi:hypothetical protein